MIYIVEYDQEGGHEGIHLIAKLFSEGWEALEPLEYHKCCGIYRATFTKRP